MPFANVPAVIWRRMAQIRKTDTKPELVVRRVVRALGVRYHLHVRTLPRSPDLAFLRRRKAIFVHGCFWRQHRFKLGRKRPASRQEYWIPKLERNVLRDRANLRALRKAGWQVLVIWECEVAQNDNACVAQQHVAPADRCAIPTIDWRPAKNRIGITIAQEQDSFRWPQNTKAVKPRGMANVEAAM
jgi:DNA mismatch endonuclease (patch repair protein)